MKAGCFTMRSTEQRRSSVPTICSGVYFENDVLEGLHSYFYTVAVSYDGFDPNEKTKFYSMEDECEKIEQEIRTKYGGRIKAAYGCSLGGSFVSLLIQRKSFSLFKGFTKPLDALFIHADEIIC